MAAPTKPEPATYTIDGFCGFVGISRRGWYRMEKRGQAPPTIRVGRKRLIRRETADQWLKDRENTTPMPAEGDAS